MHGLSVRGRWKNKVHLFDFQGKTLCGTAVYHQDYTIAWQKLVEMRCKKCQQLQGDHNV